MPIDDLMVFIFGSLLDADCAVKQIQECAQLLCRLYDTSTDKTGTQWAVLKGVGDLMTVPQPGVAMLKSTPMVLLAL